MSAGGPVAAGRALQGQGHRGLGTFASSKSTCSLDQFPVSVTRFSHSSACHPSSHLLRRMITVSPSRIKVRASGTPAHLGEMAPTAARIVRGKAHRRPRRSSPVAIPLVHFALHPPLDQPPSNGSTLFLSSNDRAPTLPPVGPAICSTQNPPS